jgi:hypothetical protein
VGLRKVDKLALNIMIHLKGENVVKVLVGANSETLSQLANEIVNK